MYGTAQRQCCEYTSVCSKIVILTGQVASLRKRLPLRTPKEKAWQGSYCCISLSRNSSGQQEKRMDETAEDQDSR